MKIVVLKFGSSVLSTPDHLPLAVSEVYRYVRGGWSVVAVVSAFRGRTDALLERAGSHGVAESHTRAALLATGEIEAASLLTGAIERGGLRTSLIEPARLGLTAAGDPLDATLVRVDPAAIRRQLQRGRVAVAPGYVAQDRHGRTVVLGRGGSDLTAVALGAALRGRVVLLKDVGWVHEWLPAEAAPSPRRFATLSWEDALALTGRAIQPKAIHYGRSVGQALRFAGLRSNQGTLVGDVESTLIEPRAAASPTPMRIALAGIGTVGGGVLERLALEPDRFRVVGVLARRFSLDRRTELQARFGPIITATTHDELLRLGPNVVVEAMGGIEAPYSLVSAALRAGISVVTANKALLAEHGDELAGIASAAGAAVRSSAAIGGSLPALELTQLASLRAPIVRLRGVLNGTSNYVLNALARGRSFSAALAAARAAGYAEADPSLDLSGTDAAQKLSLLGRLALGIDLPVSSIDRDVIDEHIAARALHASLAGTPLRQIATIEITGSRATGSVRLEPVDGRWRHLVDAENAIEITHATGRTRWFAAAGAGRWPTAESVLADLNDLASIVPASAGASTFPISERTLS